MYDVIKVEEVRDSIVLFGVGKLYGERLLFRVLRQTEESSVMKINYNLDIRQHNINFNIDDTEFTNSSHENIADNVSDTSETNDELETVTSKPKLQEELTQLLENFGNSRPTSATIEDVLDSLLGLPSASRSPSPVVSPRGSTTYLNSGTSLQPPGRTTEQEGRKNVNQRPQSTGMAERRRQRVERTLLQVAAASTAGGGGGFNSATMTVAAAGIHWGTCGLADNFLKSANAENAHSLADTTLRRHSSGNLTNKPNKISPQPAELKTRRVSFELEPLNLTREISLDSAPSEDTVKCRYSKCGRVATITEARKSYKTCHNCNSHVYCSRECRRAHWEKGHRKTCLHGRIGALCRRVVNSCKEHLPSLEALSKLARRGYLAHGRGCVKVFFSSPELAERFTNAVSSATINESLLPGDPCFIRWADLLPTEMGNEQYKEILRLCKSYNPDTRLTLYVAICVISEVPSSGAVKWERQLITRCSKVRLHKSYVATAVVQANINITRDMDNPETVILTPLKFSSSNKTRQREIAFTNIQRHLRQRGISLRKHFPEVYRKLCGYVESNDQFTPVTIYPKDSAISELHQISQEICVKHEDTKVRNEQLGVVLTKIIVPALKKDELFKALFTEFRYERNVGGQMKMVNLHNLLRKSTNAACQYTRIKQLHSDPEVPMMCQHLHQLNEKFFQSARHHSNDLVRDFTSDAPSPWDRKSRPVNSYAALQQKDFYPFPPLTYPSPTSSNPSLNTSPATSGSLFRVSRTPPCSGSRSQSSCIPSFSGPIKNPEGVLHWRGTHGGVKDGGGIGGVARRRCARCLTYRRPSTLGGVESRSHWRFPPGDDHATWIYKPRTTHGGPCSRPDTH
ncbi:hypothetical protein B566_EDAN011181 [Ephemera danica]|nr:hypothetical protein B566_EDAN011181 [Ephemera danica]